MDENGYFSEEDFSSEFLSPKYLNELLENDDIINDYEREKVTKIIVRKKQKAISRQLSTRAKVLIFDIKRSCLE